MNSKKILLFMLLFVLCGIVSCLLIIKQLYSYAIITSVCALVFLFIAVIKMFNNRTPEDRYNSFIRDALKTFDAILVNTDDIVILKGNIKNSGKIADAIWEFNVGNIGKIKYVF